MNIDTIKFEFSAIVELVIHSDFTKTVEIFFMNLYFLCCNNIFKTEISAYYHILL